MKTTRSTSMPSYIKKCPTNRSHIASVFSIAVVCVLLFSMPLIMVPKAMSPDSTEVTRELAHFEGLTVSYVDIEIENGDTISTLAIEYAEHYPGDFASYIRHIADYNSISNPDEIYAGNHLIIPYYSPKRTGGPN